VDFCRHYNEGFKPLVVMRGTSNKQYSLIFHFSLSSTPFMNCEICQTIQETTLQCPNNGFPTQGSVKDKIAFKHKLTDIFHDFKLIRKYHAGLHYMIASTMFIAALNELFYYPLRTAYFTFLAIFYMLFRHFYKAKEYRIHYSTFLTIYFLHTILEYLIGWYPLNFFESFTVEALHEISLLTGFFSALPMIYWLFLIILFVFILRALLLSRKLENALMMFRIALIRKSNKLNEI